MKYFFTCLSFFALHFLPDNQKIFRTTKIGEDGCPKDNLKFFLKIRPELEYTLLLCRVKLGFTSYEDVLYQVDE